ncbi:hypothetical protein QTJ16_000235 [Diplocarpon rosae]|uniref:Glycoside hydrolase family 5 domain-containing protein n=1 Tax=Diplocarpon rosae TaxID=946125 RepID=A0AAD9WFG9_9HELO|nr:hypothetical protein QTJ16_000235 [Diplocarpon rosae]
MRLNLSGLLVLVLSIVGGECAWPDGPLVGKDRWILNSLGQNVTYAGVNWPGAADVMIPEGLQHLSVASIVSGVKSLGMNAIRLTFAIEMIDDILDNGGDVKLSDAFNKALGTTNGPTVYNQVLKNNPGFSADTTRLQVFDAIAAECLKQNIYVHLDNHGKGWPALTSIGMRNELRRPTNNNAIAKYYGWEDWYLNMVDASKVINAANPDILIVFSGLEYDTTIQPVVEGKDLGSGTVFRKSDFSYADKIVLELHNYQGSIGSCDSLKSSLENSGFSTLRGTKANTFPILLTEWGHSQEDSSGTSAYATCLLSYLPEQKVGWFYWPLSGSYYIRGGKQDFDDPWGLYNHDWTAWRNDTNIAALKEAVKKSVA